MVEQTILGWGLDHREKTWEVDVDAELNEKQPSGLVLREKIRIYCPGLGREGVKTRAKENLMLKCCAGDHWLPIQSGRGRRKFRSPATSVWETVSLL